MNLSWKRAMHGSVLALALGAAACASRAEPDAVTPVQAAVGDEAPELAHVRMVREALSKVALRADQQQQIDTLAAAATARHAPILLARQALANALADQVQAGAIDRATLKPRLDALEQAVEAARPGEREAFLSLHGILDSAQRNQFVDALQAKAHGGAGRQDRGMQMRKWATDLNLSDQQRGQFRDAMKAEFHGKGRGEGREEMHAAMEKRHQIIESFRQDQFTLDPSFSVAPDRVERRVGRMVDLAEVAVPILTPEQRAIAAQKLRAIGNSSHN